MGAVLKRPTAGEYPTHFSKYINLVPEGDLIALLEQQERELAELFRPVTEDQGAYRYEPGKWSIKELLGHINDTERMMAGRALRIARGDRTPLAGFEQDDYVASAKSERLSVAFLLEEAVAVRKASLTLFKGLPEEAWSYSGLLMEKEISALSLACIIYGHTQHHLEIFKERYLPHL
ncbi:DinB family protein [Gorillibacterium massiliense]|uniref:DinB family protein n=1 Tax=Gorillibacterium massiliense TaxID=1280390 RepID=UPI0004AD9E6C|nr:DinB family protein [Gorillibacterium massiliense]